MCVAVVGVASAAVGGFNPFGTEQVSQTYANGILLPTNQWISPLGTRIVDGSATQQGARLVSSAISPDGRYLAALGWNNFQGFLTIFDLKTGSMVQQTALNTDDGNDPTVAADGPLFSPDSTTGISTLWVPQSEFLLKFSFNDNTGAATQEGTPIFLCGSSASQAPPGSDPAAYTYCSGYDDAGEFGENSADASDVANGAELPSGMALSPDGSKLYVALNGANKLGVIDTATGTVLDEIPVGNAPRQVALADNGNVAYVSNEGGRPSNKHDFTNLSDGTPIVSSPSTGAAITGTVSEVNLKTGKEMQEIPVGLQPTALYQDGHALFVANSNDDSLSVIDEQTNRVTQTVRTNPVPGAQVGSYANAINMSDPTHVLVSIGRDNAIAVYRYQGLNRQMRFAGLIPTDWYPVQVQPDPALGANTIVVTNDKGIGAQGPKSTINKGYDTTPATDHNTYDDTGSVTTFTMPHDGQLWQDTQTVFTDDDWNQIKPINQGDYDTAPNVIPAHLGGSSPIKHVVVIVRENRTYDQELGDITSVDGQPSNGDPADAQFGEQVTPNAHALANRFGDLDNFYDEGTLSADGHNWIVQAEANDYVEKEFGAFYRSYPSQAGDALAYQRDGFLWNAAEKAGLDVQNFGEYIYNPYSLPSGAPEWDTWYAESQWLEDGQKGTEPISKTNRFQRPLLLHEGAVGHPVAAGDHRSLLPELPALDPGPVPGRPVAAGVRAAGEERPDAQPVVHVADDRPHHRHRRPGPGRPGRRQRPGRRPRDRHDLAQQVLEEHRDLHRGGRHPERRRPRRRPPRAGVRRQPVLGLRGGRQLLHPARHGQDNRADPRHPPDEPGGPGRGADVRRVHEPSERMELRAVRRGAESDPAHPGRTRVSVHAHHAGSRRQRGRAQSVPRRRGSSRPTCSRSTGPGRSGAPSRPLSTTSTVRTTSTRSR